MLSHDEEIYFAERLKRLRNEEYEKVFIGMLISKMRKYSKMTQKELASKLSTTQSVVARVEHGKQNLTIKMLVKIASVFGKKLNLHFS